MPQDMQDVTDGSNNEPQNKPLDELAQAQSAQANPNPASMSPQPTAPQSTAPAAAVPSTPAPQADRPFFSPPAAATSTNAAAPVSSARGHGSKGKYLHLAVHTVLLVALLVTAFQFFKAESDKSKLQEQVVALQSNPLLVAERKTQNTIEKVSRLAALPTNETPTVSEVSDAEAVKKSIVGLTDVQNGDNLLFYFQAGKFIQYRPSTDKIILNQPLNVK